MSKRRRAKEKRKALQAQQKALRPANRLAEAMKLAQQGDVVAALHLADGALAAANDDRTVAQAGQLASELHFRLAAQAALLRERLHHLEAGDALAPDAQRARFAYHKGLTLLALRQWPAACQELSRARALGRIDRTLDLSLALAQLLAGQEPEVADLSADQRDTLAALSAMYERKSAPVELATVLERQPDDNLRTVWRNLLQMSDSSTSSPLANLADAAAENDVDLAQPIIDYYVGVAALRRRDHVATTEAWGRAQNRGLETPWFVGNQVYLLRQEIDQVAEQGEWTAVVERLTGHPGLTADTALQESLAYAHYYLGEEAARDRRWQATADHWRRSFQLTPSRYGAQNLAVAEEALENWSAAAEAWRDLAKRRPRKKEHPDYLDEIQVATIWRRASDCYGRAELFGEQVACLSRAIEYAPANLAWRMELVDAYLSDTREEAAENELQRILEIDAEYVPGLLLLANLWDERWDRNSLPIWQRAVAVDPANLDARDGLASAYVEKADRDSFGLFSRFSLGRGKGGGNKLIEQGLKELPGHPILLIAAGTRYAHSGKEKQARASFSAAVQAALQHPIRYDDPLGSALHELLHVDGGADVERLIPEFRQVKTLRPLFWIAQGGGVLACQLDPAWADRFWQEAIALAEQRQGHDSPALTLAKIMDALASMASRNSEPAFVEYAQNSVKKYAALGATIAPGSGIDAYAEAVQTAFDDSSAEKTERLLHKAKRQARRAGNDALVEHIEQVEFRLQGPSAAMLDRLLSLNPADLADLLGSIDLDDDDDDDDW